MSTSTPFFIRTSRLKIGVKFFEKLRRARNLSAKTVMYYWGMGRVQIWENVDHNTNNLSLCRHIDFYKKECMGSMFCLRWKITRYFWCYNSGIKLCGPHVRKSMRQELQIRQRYLQIKITFMYFYYKQQLHFWPAKARIYKNHINLASNYQASNRKFLAIFEP